jgi:hypothetical protein
VAAPAANAPFFKNERRLIRTLVSDCFILCLLLGNLAGGDGSGACRGCLSR